MASGGPENTDEFAVGSPGSAHSGIEWDDSPSSSPNYGRDEFGSSSSSSAYSGIDFDDISYYGPTTEIDLAQAPAIPNPGTPSSRNLNYLKEYYDFVSKGDIWKFAKSLEQGSKNLRNYINQVRSLIINTRFCKGALCHLCDTYASESQKQALNEKNWNLGDTFAVIEILLLNCQGRLSQICDHCQRSAPARGSPYHLPRPIIKDPLDFMVYGKRREVKKDLPHQVPQKSRASTSKRLYNRFAGSIRRVSGNVRDKIKGEQEMLRRSPFEQEYPEQQLDDSLLIDETPPRQHSRSFSPPRIEITPPSITDLGTRFNSSPSPTAVKSPPRTPFISRSRFGHTDPTVPRGELNIPPGPFEFPTPYRRTIALSSPKLEEPLFVNISVDPKPLIDTERGERFVCDISVDVQSEGSDLQAQLAHVSGRGRTPEMSVSPVIKRGRMGQHSVIPVSNGLFTPRIYRRHRRRRIPGSHPISELPWSPTYLPEDARSPVSGVTSPPYLSDKSISWERSADSYYGSPDISPVIRRPTCGYRSPDFWNRSASPMIKMPTYGYPSTASSPSPVIKRPPYGYRSPDFWSRPIYGYRSPYSDRSSQSKHYSFSPHMSETSGRHSSPERTNVESERDFQEGSLYDPSIVNEAIFLDDRYFSPEIRAPRTNMESERPFQNRSPYDSSIVNEARILGDRYFSTERTNVESERDFLEGSLYDPSIVNEAIFLDDRYFSPEIRAPRTNMESERPFQNRLPYDSSIVNEARILDDRYFSPDRTYMESERDFLEGSLYDSSIVNEARFLD